MTEAQVVLPRLAGSRSAARKLVQGADAPLNGSIVVLDCRQLRSAPPSFADEIVKATLEDGGAVSLTLQHASEDFIRYIRESAKRRHIAPNRVDVLPAAH